MEIELKVPAVGESITEVEIGDWLKKEGDSVGKDENLVVLETDKATVELPSPNAGQLIRVLKKKGETAKVGEVIALIGDLAEKPKAETPSEPRPEAKPEATARVMPAAARLIAENNLPVESVTPTGPGGRVLKEDVQQALRTEPPKAAKPIPPPASPAPAAALTPAPGPAAPSSLPASAGSDRPDEVVPMTRLRRTLAERLVQVQNTAALLTTFNEIDMSAVMDLRKQFQEAFVQKYGIKLGFMSFFVKATIDALKLTPQVNAEIRGTDIVYHNYFDIGVAVGGGKGLVVPVIRHADRLSFSQLELAIQDFGKRAKHGKLKVEELQGGTFTISNGGVYGSLLSTPIINPPQSGILGMHAIQDRPVAREGAVVIRPMMYLALTYDHRLVDGREAVTFLKRIKEVIENPTRMLLEV